LKEEHLYKTTQKGIQALQAYNGMRELIDWFRYQKQII
jgi:predicted transcriptional regulator